MIERVAEYADGWMPILGRGAPPDFAALRAACEKRGRRFDALQLALFYAPDDEAQARARLAEGYHELIFGLPSAGRDEILPRLDQLAGLAERLHAG